MTRFCIAFLSRYSPLEPALVSVLVTRAGMRPLERLRDQAFSTLPVLQIIFSREYTAPTHPFQRGKLKVAQLKGPAISRRYPAQCVLEPGTGLLSEQRSSTREG